MRSKQLAGWLLSALLLVPMTGDSSALAAPAQTGSAAAESTAREPLAQVRRVALWIPESSPDELVQRTIAAERANHARRRRPGLFAPKPPAGSAKSASKTGKAGAKKSANSDAAPHPDAPEFTPEQLRALTEELYWDALVDTLDKYLDAQVVSQTDMLAALKDLKLPHFAAPSGAALSALCEKLNCEALIVPAVCRIRTGEGDIRALSMWSGVKVIRPALPGARGKAQSTPEYPVAGASFSERAPFQDRFFKDWPQLSSEAAKQAAGVAGRTLNTGIVAPFVGERDRVAIAPVSAPRQADALMFHAGGRTVIPAALNQMPVDVSPYFRPDLLPIFADAVISYKGAASALAADRRRIDSLWTRNETPDRAGVVALGRRLKVQYVLMASVPDLEMAIATVPSSKDVQTAGVPVGETEAQESATAEAIGALVRVSDGAVLWNARTTATMTGGTRANETPAAARRRVAMDAVRFSLVQLERRFRQYRHRFE